MTLDLPDASIDLVVSNLGINNFDNAEAVLGTCFRVMRPGGHLLLTTNLVGHMRELYDTYRTVLVEQGLTDRLATLDAHVAHRATVESVRAMLTRARFGEIDVTTDQFPMRFADGTSLLRHFFIRFGFLPAWRSIVPEDAVDKTLAALERRLNEVAAARGELALTIPMALVEARKSR